MKYTRSFIYGVVSCGIALAMVSSALAQSGEGSATVLRIKGSARYTLGNNIWQPLKAGDVLRPGTVVQTDRESGSYVDLALGEGTAPVVAAPQVAAAPAKGGSVRFQPATAQNTVRVFENTVLGIDKLAITDTGADVVTDTQLDLKAGRIIGNVKKMSAASRYEIKLPNGVAGIRGTIYDITANGLIRVVTGSMVISFVDAQGNVQTRVVVGGQEYNPRTDQITPISAETADAIKEQTTGLVTLSTVGGPRFVTVDRTIFYLMSDTTGAGGGGGGGGGSGEGDDR